MKWAIKRQAPGPGNWQPREAAVRAGCQTQQCPAEDSSLYAKHCSAALVPKQTDQPAPATFPTLSLREGIYFSNSESKGFYSFAWSHFLNPKFSICGLRTGCAMGTTARTYVNDKSYKKPKISGGHLHVSEGGTQENNWICKNPTGVLLPLFLPFVTLLPFPVLCLIHSVFRENLCWLTQLTACTQEVGESLILFSEERQNCGFTEDMLEVWRQDWLSLSGGRVLIWILGDKASTEINTLVVF